jgi:hypothetical protein
MMIQGLKLTFTGEEIIRSLDALIEECRASIQFKRDEIDGKIEPKGPYLTQVPAEAVEEEIRQVAHRIQTLTLFRERVMPAEVYLLGRKALNFAGLLPRPPAPLPEIDLEEGIRWVTRA